MEETTRKVTIPYVGRIRDADPNPPPSDLISAPIYTPPLDPLPSLPIENTHVDKTNEILKLEKVLKEAKLLQKAYVRNLRALHEALNSKKIPLESDLAENAQLTETIKKLIE